MKTIPKISVVIPTHKDLKKVSKAIDSLLTQTLKPLEIIIIDNHSSENLKDKLKRKYKSKNIRIFRLEANTGVTGGRNAGILETSPKSNFIFFFDHDMIADKKMLEKLFLTQSKHNSGIVTPKILYKSEPKIIWSAGTDIDLVTGRVIFRSGRDVGQFNKDVKVNIAPAAMLVDKKVIDKIGGFDNRYFATYEDSDFCFRAARVGFSTYYSSGAIAYHDLDRNIEQDAERLIGRAYWVARNRILFMDDFSSNFLLFLVFLPIYSIYYLILAVRTNQVSKFFSQYVKGLYVGLFEALASRLSKYIPFSYHSILRKELANARTILDIGCGDGLLMKDLAHDSQEISGLEIYQESILLAKATGVYKEILKCDVTKVNNKIVGKKFNLVFCSQVVEHLDKKTALQSIKMWQKMSKDKVMITTTNGFIEFDPIEEKEELNPYQKHKSGWSITDFEELGFSVHGQGLKAVYGENGFARKSPKWMINIWSLVSLIFAPFSYYFPKYSMYLIAIKRV